MKIRIFPSADALPLDELKKIETTISPFQIYPGETLQELPAPEVHAPVFVGEKDEVERLVVFLVSRYLFVTSAILEKALNNIGVVVAKKDLQKILKRLNAAEFVRSFRFFTSNENRSANKVYSIGWRGIGFLKEKDKTVSLLGYSNRLIENGDVCSVKKILSAVQFSLFTKNGTPETVSIAKTVFATDPNGDALPNAIFRPQAIIRDGERTIFVVSIRRNCEGTKDLVNKIQRIKKTVKYGSHNIKFDVQKTSLILLCEDSTHMKEVLALIQSSFYSIGIPIRATTDSLSFSDHEYLYAVKPSLFSALFSA